MEKAVSIEGGRQEAGMENKVRGAEMKDHMRRRARE